MQKKRTKRLNILKKRLVEKGIKIYYPVQTNMVFCMLEQKVLDKITEKFDLHYWDEFKRSVRLGVTYCTTKADIDELISLID